jgi:predicted amidohydrolase YtcJ
MNSAITIKRLAFTAPFLLSLGAIPTTALAQASPTLLFVNGEVITPQGNSEAVAVKDGTIIAVGNRADVTQAAGQGAQVVDMGGKTLMPGLYDAHVHLFFAGRDKLSCRFPQGAKASVIAGAVKACVAKAKPGQWILGGSWVGAAFKKDEQHKRLLDAVAPDNPVVLNDESLHSIWVNSRALELGGVTKATADPQGGVIDRDAKGEPTGVLRELATLLVESKMPTASDEEQVAAVKVATDEMLSYGIVGIIEAGLRTEYARGLANYAKSGGLKQYTRGCIVFGPNSQNSEGLVPDRQSYTHGRLQMDCIKLFLDGVPIESRTAAMIDPYAPRAGHAHDAKDERGLLLIPQDELNRIVSDFDSQGLHIKFHAAGDGATRAAADAIAFARKRNGWTGPRHDIGHNTFIASSDVGRARELNFTWELSPYIWWPTPITSVDIATAVGPERMKRLWPAKDVVESGANVVIGSDWPVVPSVNPWLAFETLVTRQVPGAMGEPMNAGQSITREQALMIMTRNGAIQMGRLDRGGTIEVGKYADMIIVDRNPLTAPVGELHKTKVLKTYIRGEQVYAAGESVN